MNPVLTHPSWSQVDKGCALLAAKILREVAVMPDAIVGLARGGLIPAVIISHILGLKVFPVSYSSKVGNGEYREYDNTLPEVPGQVLLIVDDIVDTGFTMREVMEHYSSTHTVFTASLYYKEVSVFKPYFLWQQIPHDSPWIIFPWEV